MELYDRISAGERIRERRILLGLTQEELAEKIGRAYKYCQDIERGSCGMSIETLIKFATALNVSLDYLIYGYRDDPAEQTPALAQTQEAVLSMLGQCSEAKRHYALEMLKLFLKACNL